MKASRAGAIRNLNVQPLIAGIEARDDFIIETVARVVGLFEQGELDVALVPAVEVARHEPWEVLLDCGAVSCDGPLRSTLAVSNVPWTEVKRVALDAGSRAGSLLLQVLLARQVAPGQEIEYERIETFANRVPEGFDACLVTGLRALKWPGFNPLTGEYTPDDDDLPKHLIDLGEQWKQYCDLPFVTSVWVCRDDHEVTEWHLRLAESAHRGRQMAGELAETMARRHDMGIDPDVLRDYLSDIIRYDFGEREIRGMMRFLDEVTALDLAPIVPDRALGFRPLPRTGEGSEATGGITELGEVPVPDEPLRFDHFSAVRSHGPTIDPLTRANRAFIRREYRAALKALEDGMRADPAFLQRAEVQLLGGRCSYHLQRPIEARIALYAALRTTDDAAHSRMARFTLARLYLDEGRYEQSAGLLRGILVEAEAGGLTSWKMHCHALLATCALMRGLNRRSEFWREQAEAVHLTSSELLVEHGRALAREQLWDEAAAYFGEAVNVDPTNPFAYFQLANLFYVHGQYLKSEEILAYGLEQAHEEIVFFALLGDLRRDQGKLADAVTLFRLALEFSPRGRMADYLLSQIGHAQCLQGDYQEARQHFQLVVDHFRRSPLRKECEWFAERLANAPEGPGGRTVVPNFPGGIQLPDFCGPKVAASVLIYHGVTVDQREVAAEVFRGGALWPDLRTYVERVGLRPLALKGSKQLLIDLIEAGLPAILCEYRGLEGHFLAAIGYDPVKDSLVVQDPAFQSPVDIPWPEVEANWGPASGALIVPVPDSHAERVAEMGLEEHEGMLKLFEAQRAFADDEHDTALELAQAAEQLDESLEAVQKLLTELDLEAGNTEAAQTRCERMLEAAPDGKCFWASKYLGDTQLASGDAAAAIGSYNRAMQIHRDEGALWWTLGVAYETCGNLLRARQCYTRSTELELDPGVAVRLAQVLRQQKRIYEAAYWFEIAREMDPASEEAIAGLEWFANLVEQPATPGEAAFAAVVGVVPLDEDPDETTDAAAATVDRTTRLDITSFGENELIIDDDELDED